MTRKRGRPTLTGEKMVQTAVWLRREQIEYLKSRGNLSGRVREMIDGDEGKMNYSISVIAKEIIKERVNIRAADGVIQFGYKLEVTVEWNGKQARFVAATPLLYGRQTEEWCIEHCERASQGIPEKVTAGELHSLAHSYAPLTVLGIPTPPEQPQGTDENAIKEHHRATGEPGICYYNSVYRQWAIQFNEWVRNYHDLANEYMIGFIDADYIPVKP